MGRQGKVNKCSHFLKWCKQEKIHLGQRWGGLRLFSYSCGKPFDCCGSRPSPWPQCSSSAGGHPLTYRDSHPSHTGSGLTCVASRAGQKAALYLRAQWLPLCHCVSFGALMWLNVGKTSCHAVKTLKRSCGETPVGSNQSRLLGASISLLAVWVTYLGNRPSSPAKPSDVCRLS